MAYSYKNFKYWNPTKLWRLRNEIVLGSLFLSDYYNRFGIPENIVHDFFESYLNYLFELEEETKNDAFLLDSKDELWNWFGCYDICPFS
jgi:hypothetical protein